MGQPEGHISWSDPGDVAEGGASIGCGSYVYQVLKQDGTALDNTVFSEDYAGANTKILRV